MSLCLARLDDESPMQRITSLIERRAPGLMRAGGGSLIGDGSTRTPAQQITPDIVSKVFEQAGARKPQWLIAQETGISESSVSKILNNRRGEK